jgi:hypothetical protein
MDGTHWLIRDKLTDADRKLLEAYPKRKKQPIHVVQDIKSLYASGVTISEIATLTGVGFGRASSIVHGRTYRDVVADPMKPSAYPVLKKPRKRKACPQPYYRGQSGRFYSSKMQQYFGYQSSWELARMQLFEIDPNVIAYKRIPVRLPYIVNGKKHRYDVDLEVRHADGSIALEEIKPRDVFTRYNNLYKLAVLRKYCKVNGYGCRILTSLEACKELTTV